MGESHKQKKYQLLLKPSAQKELDKIPAPFRERINHEFDALLEDPFIGKKLSGHLAGVYSVRVWPYRIAYLVENQRLIIIIISVRHRKDVYRKI